MKKTVNVIIFILFNALLFFTLINLNYVFRNKEYEGAQDKFKKWCPEEADIVFVGNSHQFCSINTDLLYDEYGIESFMLATSGQTVPMSYYAAMEAIELKHPKTIVFEVCYTANDFRTLKGMDHCFFDGFPRCKARKLALEDLTEPEERLYYLFPLGMFHSRWKELSEADFKDFPISDRGSFVSDEVVDNYDPPIQDPNVKEAMPKEMEKYMEMLIDLCKANDVKLILYSAPFNGLYLYEDYAREDVLWRQSIFNYVGDFAKERGVEFHNLFYEYDKLGINNDTDWMDTQHFNRKGQEKFTRYMMESGYLGY